MQKTNFKTLDLCMIGVVTAVIVIMAQISIPMPLGVPMTMQTFAITLAGIILGSKKGAVASLIYVLLGAVGVPRITQKVKQPLKQFLYSTPSPIMNAIIGNEMIKPPVGPTKS